MSVSRTGLSVVRSEVTKPGGLLMGFLLGRMAERGQTFKEMADELGVTYGYLHQLRSGVKKVSAIGEDFVTSCANYLGINRMAVMMAAGQVKPLDLAQDQSTVIDNLPSAMQVIATDPQIGPLFPPELYSLGVDAQVFLVRLYERATGKVLLSGFADPNRLMQEIENYRKLAVAEAATV